MRRASWKLEPTDHSRDDDHEITLRHPSAVKLEDLGLIREVTDAPTVGAWRRTSFVFALTDEGRALAATLTEPEV